jgi:hypothetical protein
MSHIVLCCREAVREDFAERSLSLVYVIDHSCDVQGTWFAGYKIMKSVSPGSPLDRLYRVVTTKERRGWVWNMTEVRNHIAGQ